MFMEYIRKYGIPYAHKKINKSSISTLSFNEKELFAMVWKVLNYKIYKMGFIPYIIALYTTYCIIIFFYTVYWFYTDFVLY